MTFEERVIDRERLLVIDNIERAIEDGDSFRKVEIGDPLVTEEMRKRAILPFDIERKKPINKLLSFIARRIEKRLRNARTLDFVSLRSRPGSAQARKTLSLCAISASEKRVFSFPAATIISSRK